MKTETKSLILGVILTLSFTGIGYFYLSYKNKISLERQPAPFLEALEILDLRFNDFKYKIRGERPTEAPTALIAIDDLSLKYLGRWPWSRKVIGELTQKLLDYGVATVGFDAIFSEPERGDATADASFGAVIEKDQERVILGTFGENAHQYRPYQDLCVTEAFLATGGDLIVKGGVHIDKMNTTVSVEDTTESPFESLFWQDLFKGVFENRASQAESLVFKEFEVDSVDKLSDYQKSYLENEKFNSYLEYCQTWDPDAKASMEEQRPFRNLLSKDPALATLSYENAIHRLKTDFLPHPIPQMAQWTPNIPVLQTPAKYTASFVADLDSDGYIRRYPLFYRAGNRIGSSFIPSLALQSFLLTRGLRAEVKIDRRPVPQVGKYVASVSLFKEDKKVGELPVDSMGKMMVNYYGPRSTLPYVSAKDLFNDKETMTIQKRTFNPVKKEFGIQDVVVNKKDFLKDRSVIIGATAVGIYDLRNVPLESNYPGPEVHVSMLANLLDGDFIRVPKNETLWLTITLGVVGSLLSWAWAFLGPVSSMGLAGLAFLAMGVIDYFLFIKQKTLVSSVLILVEFGSIYFMITIYKYFTEERKKRELKSTFSKYVSPAVVDELLKDAENLKLGGRKQRMTAFFSDVRGFTTISEKLSPTDLSKLLNRYLTPMTEIVFANNGTLDKYMGDAIMAFFGAPINDEHHAEQACRCALQSIAKLKEIQKELAAEGLPNIDIGIGINTGEMSVGNMGSNIVQNYTVMGDSVNLASRLEGINKEYGTRIIISEFTHADVHEKFVTREVDRVKVKGKNEPVRIFEVIQEGALSEKQEKHLSLYKQGYELYYQREFSKAKACFAEAALMEPEDEVSRLYIERCDDYLAEPPAAEWDGVYVMKTK